MVKNSAPRIAILGWGSLIWDKRPEFDDYHEVWQADGPILPLEFSRISVTRKGALTLVIDPDNGQDCEVQYATSRRTDPDDAIADLRIREGTILKRIGFWFASGDRACPVVVPSAVPEWAQAKGFDVVVWTGLSSNFEVETGRRFTVDAALAHLQALPPEGKVMAAEYIQRAPSLVQTPLRAAIQAGRWSLPPIE